MEVPITLALAAGEYMESARLLQWLKRPGDSVVEGEPVAVVETAKASSEVTAPASGVLVRVLFEEKSEVPIGQVLGWLEVPARSPTAPAPGRISATPAARRLAQQLGVDLGLAVGTGPGGQVRESDIRTAAELRRAEPELAYEVLPESPYRTVAARRMAQSAAIPQFHLTIPLKMTVLMAARIQAGAEHQPTITAMLVKAVALALGGHPRLNAGWVDGKVRHYLAINIGVAVATDLGLVVPVIHGADRLSPPEIDRQLEEKRERATQRSLTPNDVKDSTFTISNLGQAGVLHFTALINPPQTAILAVGALHTGWSGEDSHLGPEPICFVTLTGDHRAMDGMDAARFAQTLKSVVESPETWSDGLDRGSSASPNTLP